MDKVDQFKYLIIEASKLKRAKKMVLINQARKLYKEFTWADNVDLKEIAKDFKLAEVKNIIGVGMREPCYTVFIECLAFLDTDKE